MEIIQLQASNSQLLDNVAVDVFDNEVCPHALSAFLTCPRHIMLLALNDGIVIGMLSAVEYFHPDKPAQLWINEIGVTPNHRNKGVGRMLINQLISLAKKRGCSYAWLGTEKTNLAAKRCFASIGEGKPPQDFVLYEWDIE